MQLKDFDIDWFMREIWQKKPLLIRNAFAHWENPVEPDELAGLACEDDIESRLITENRTTGTFMVEHGPFPESRFAEVPPSHWTLLVQAADHWVPEVATLIEPFRFIPDWRIDDVMISYADDGGSVGPHFDQYDVFLIQGLGQRRWQVGARCDKDTALLDNPQLRLLANFESTEEWILEPGDILYVPPRFAHHGVAIGNDCMTYSIGFRAPGQSELISHWCDHVLESVSDDDRFEDVDRVPARNPGEISVASLERLRELAIQKLADPDSFCEWFGSWTTEPKYPQNDYTSTRPISVKTLLSRLQQFGALHRNPAIRFAFVGGDDVLLFVDGHSHRGLDIKFVEYICANICWSQSDLAPWLESIPQLNLLCALFNQGSVYFDESDVD